ncbi:MAG TPA: hypothetical protein VFR58_10685 [Flavisolibacter sp.]|nr:hypothetical protein [Flavisolibacter sp.]
MRTILLAVALFFSFTAPAQFYYQDIVGSAESTTLMKNYLKNKVSRVVIRSYGAGNTANDDFYAEQQFNPATRVLKTTTRAGRGFPSVLFSYADAEGRVIKTVDSSRILVSTTLYGYNEAGRLVSVSSSSIDSSGSLTNSEEHLWQWAADQPSKMIRIRNRVDSSMIELTLDEKGNIAEEVEVRRKKRSQPVYYYYNDNNLLTDIVRYNQKAGRLLPETMFEYSAANQVIQRITVPGTSGNYLIWRYQYNEAGLKTKEAIYSKDDKRTPIGRIEYQYSFGS